MLPLEGIRVIDLSRLLPGPACTWYLYGLGAEVVKVEDPVGGDYLRHVPPLGPDGIGVWFTALNAGKRSITLDLRTPEGAAALRGLLREADVLVEGFRPGVLARLGLDPAELIVSYPRLVVASITGYGQTGPLRDQPGHDLNYVGLTGMLSLAKRHDGAPDVPGVQVADLAGGALTAALGIAAALVQRGRTGRGQWVDVSMTEGALALAMPALAAEAAGEPQAPGAMPLTGGLSAYRVYETADGGLISLAALEPKFWDALCAAVGEDLSRDEASLQALFRGRTRDAWAALLPSACVAPVLGLSEVPCHPQHVARGVFTGEGPTLRMRPPFPGARTGDRAPALGEHNALELAPLASMEKA